MYEKRGTSERNSVEVDGATHPSVYMAGVSFWKKSPIDVRSSQIWASPSFYNFTALC